MKMFGIGLGIGIAIGNRNWFLQINNFDSDSDSDSRSRFRYQPFRLYVYIFETVPYLPNSIPFFSLLRDTTTAPMTNTTSAVSAIASLYCMRSAIRASIYGTVPAINTPH
jgi:hypothetical protein